jgi:geranylgeranyl diphosphate/geranylgeranyl-bacteriochlorophyllide a reductase
LSYDVVIVGAGPAGCAAALCLPPGARGLLVDRSAPNGDSCCGGLLAPDAQEALAGLGLSLPDDVRVRPEPRTVRVRDLDSGLRQTYRRDYLNVDRGRFDAWLLSLAAQQVEVVRGTRFAGVGPEGVVLRSGARTWTVPATGVIGADGAGSAVRKACFATRPGPPLMVALQARFAHTDPPAPEHVVLFSSSLTGFYAWAIPKEHEWVVGCAFHDRRVARERFERVLDWYRAELGLEGPPLARSGRYLSQPWAWSHLHAGDGSVLLVGEAAGLVSPSSGEGISYALLSGAAAGRSREAYRKAFAPLARKIMVKTVKAKIIYSPAARRLTLRLPWCP